MAGDRKPGPQNPSSNPLNIRDGTNSLQPTSKPSTSGFWQGVESAADGVYEVLSKRLLTLANQALSAVDLQRSLFAKYGDQAAAEAEKYFGYVTDQVKNAADWESLNKLTGPVLGQESFQAGVVVGFGESLVGDAAGLLGLLKMLVLAGIYQRTQSPSTLMVDPMSAVMLLAVKCVPSFAEQTKAADEQLQKMVKELFEIAKHPLDFIDAVGKSAWKGGMDDLEQLKFYAHQNTLMSQFQAGRIVGRVLYQVIMAILMVVGAAGAVAKLASKFPELLRIAGIVSKGGELGDLVEVTEAGGGAAKAVEKGPEFVKVDDFGKSKPVPSESEPAPPPVGPPKPPPLYKTKPMNPHYQGENLPGNKIWRGKQVKYLSDAERSTYKLEIRNGKIYDANGQLFDTGDATSAHSGSGRAIFVMDENGNFYASKEQIVGGFHHSSLLAGQPVAAAGELQVEKGVLKVISDKSGHYMPGRQFSQQAIDSLKRSGMNTSAVQTDYVAP